MFKALRFHLVHAMNAVQCQVAADLWTKSISLSHKNAVGCQQTTLATAIYYYSVRKFYCPTEDRRLS